MESLSKQGDNTLVLDISIESKLVGISFIENDQNWPIYVKDVKRVSRLWIYVSLVFLGDLPFLGKYTYLFIYVDHIYVSEI